jgi:hypothetical protein
MENKHTEKTIGRRTFLKAMGVTALGVGAFGFPAPNAILRLAQANQPGEYDSLRTAVSAKESDIAQRQPKRAPFYSHIATDQIEPYQGYINRAFGLSPTLEFEENHYLFSELLAEAAARDSLSELDLELMRLQYVYADRSQREKYRTSWAEKVINREDTDFFPDPWDIISAIFAKDELGTYVRYEV